MTVCKLNHPGNLISGRRCLPCLWPVDVMEAQMQMSFGSQKERWSEVGGIHDGNDGVRLQTARLFSHIPVAVHHKFHPEYSNSVRSDIKNAACV